MGVNLETFGIGEAARRTGVGPHALRYYERIGLLSPICRGANGRRRYSEEDLAWVRFLTILRRTGMPIRSMLRFVELERTGDVSVEARTNLLEDHREEVCRRLRELEECLGAIEAKISHYRGVSDSCVEPAVSNPREVGPDPGPAAR